MKATEILESLDFGDFQAALGVTAKNRAARVSKFEEKLANFTKPNGFLNWSTAKRQAFIEEAGGETISDFVALFTNVLDRMLLPKYKAQTPDWRQYVKTGTNKDFRSNMMIGTWGLRGRLDSRTQRGEYKERQLKDGKTGITVGLFGNRLALGWELFINDDLNALADLAQDFVTAALRTEWSEVTKLFVLSTGPHTSLYGTSLSHPIDSATINNKGILDFSIDALGSTIALMRAQKDADGEPIITTSFKLVVPPALEIPAKKALNQAQLIAVGFGASAATQTSANVVATAFNIVPFVNPYLPLIDTSGNVDKTWYVFADPVADGPAVQMQFLQGHETPEVVVKAPNKLSLGGGAISAMEGDYETDKYGLRVRHIMGGGVIDPRMTYAQVGA